MSPLLSNDIYKRDIQRIADIPLEWERLQDSVFLISGATGMVGSFLIDVLLFGKPELNIKVIALVRDAERAKARFSYYLEAQQNNLRILATDVNVQIPAIDENFDYAIHAASQTHPRAYATAPIQTLMTNVVGTDRMLRCALAHNMKRFMFLSSVEIYGENRGDIEKFQENYCGYIDCNTLRAGYPEGKRAGEALCQAYIHEKGMDIVIPRLSRVYGPSMLLSDTKAISQFIKNGMCGEDIVLKSEGKQLYSYCYVADAVCGLLYCLVRGKSGEAYNISGEEITLAGLAGMIADYVGTKVVFDIPDDTERAGYSTATKAVLDTGKLRMIGWEPQFAIHEGLAHTIDVLRRP